VGAFQQARHLGAETGLEWPFFLIALWTASKVFSRLEGALDLVFQVERRRPYVLRKFLAFGLVLSLAVVLVVLTVLAGALAAFNRFLEQATLVATATANPLYLWLNGAATRYFIPWTVSVLAFTFVYRVMPACRVPWPAAVVSGVIAGSLWETLKHVFASYVSGLADYERTYGALEAVVVFAIWVDLSAVVLLWGGELAAVAGRFRQDDRRGGLEGA
jgi:membrane protein